MLFNTTITNGHFPIDWKINKTIPVLKNNSNKSHLHSYRPISITPVFSKIFEKIVYFRICSFLEKNKILSPQQHGFRPNHDTSTAIAAALREILSSLDSGEHILVLFCDLKNVFEVVDFVIMLDKLEKYGIRGPALDWFRTYLIGRVQCVQNSSTDGIHFYGFEIKKR